MHPGSGHLAGNNALGEPIKILKREGGGSRIAGFTTEIDMRKTGHANLTNLSRTMSYADPKYYRRRFPRRVFVVLALCVGVLVAGIGYATR